MRDRRDGERVTSRWRLLPAMLATLVATAAGGCLAESDDTELGTDELVCGGPGCTCGPTFGLGLVQSTWGSGTKKNFEAVFPRAGGGLSHYHRDNNYISGNGVQQFPWFGPTSFGAGDVGGVSLIQSNFGLGNLEVVATIGNQLVTYNREDGTTWSWVGPTVISNGVKGQPGFIQGNSGVKGNFEVVVPSSGNGLLHFYRNNDAAGLPWAQTALFGTGFNYEAAALIRSSYGGGTHLEVIARTGTAMHAFYRDSAGTWSGPSVMTSSGGQPITGKGTFDFVQSTWGSGAHKNFELVLPRPAGGLAHYSRDNTTGAWSAPTVIDASGDYTAVGLIQSTFGNGNLEIAARKNGELVWGYRDDGGSWGWSARYGFGAEPCCDPAVKGQWTDPFDTGTVGIHGSLLPTGKVLFFGYADNTDAVGQSSVYNPTTGLNELTGYSPLSHHPELFCSGHALTPDGRVWVAGGHHTDVDGSHTFSPSTQTWTRHGKLDAMGTFGRWYPTNATLPDGRIFTISGTLAGGPVANQSDVNNTWQLFDPTTNTMTARTAVGPSPFSTDGFAPVDLYPFVYPVPSGVHAGKVMVHARQTTRFLQVSTNTWSGQAVTDSPYSRTYPAEGTSAMLMLSPSDGHRARVLAIGGAGVPPLSASTPATATVEMLDLGTAAPDWQTIAPMSEPRVLPDSVLLPDGKVFVVGGSRSGKADNGTDPVLTPEVYNPSTGTWTSMCPMRVPRLYHSTALLLPDARVLVAGRDGVFNAAPYNWPERRGEIYSPPYLFAGPRPTITTAPTTLAHGATFNVAWSGAPGMTIGSAVLMRLGSVTHSFNMNQRGVRLTLGAQTTSSVSLVAPPSATVAPPGHYMLFLLSSTGVPSVAAILRLG